MLANFYSFPNFNTFISTLDAVVETFTVKVKEMSEKEKLDRKLNFKKQRKILFINKFIISKNCLL